MIERTIDPTYLAHQYGDSEKLQIRLESHARYSERPAGNWHAEMVSRLDLAPGSLLLDVGCGPGAFHAALTQAGLRVLGFDRSAGMAREARERALQEGWPVQIVQADAEAIPLADDACDAALASHMLYYAPDIRRALTEIRRVVRSGGHVLITTNAADHSERLHALHAEAARDLGYTPTHLAPTKRFNLDHLPLVQSVFPTATRHDQPNAFVFPTTEAALRYFASGIVNNVEEYRSDGSHRPPLIQRVAERIAEIIAREGVFRVPKDGGYILATVEG